MTLGTLASICDVIMGQAPPGEAYNDKGVGVPLIAGASDFGETTPQPSRFTSISAKRSKPGDIILCVRATIGDLNWSDREYCLGRGVAGIRVKPSLADSHYVWHAIKANSPRLSALGRGATFKQISRSDINEFHIPLPPLPQQRRIAAILDQADELRRKRRAANNLLQQLAVARFRSLLATQSTGPERHTAKMGDLCDLVRGSSPRPQGDPRYFGGPVPRLMIADITRDGMFVTPRIDSLTLEGATRSRPMPAGSVVMAVSGAVGLPAILSVDACIHDGFVGFRELDKRVTREFLYFWLLSMQAENRSKGTGAIWVNLTTDQVKSFDVPVPSSESQKELNRFTRRLDPLGKYSHGHLAKLDTLFASLQNRAFSGELTSKQAERELEMAS